MKVSKEKIALFDFCDTLVSFQTANEYVRFYMKNYASLGVKIKHILYLILSVSGIIDRLELKSKDQSVRKRLLLWQLKGCHKSKMESAAEKFYQKCIKPRVINETLSELKQKQADNWCIFIVSGGYDIYINFFALEYGIELTNVIANHLLFKNEIFIGKYDLNCMGEEKVKLLKNKINRENSFVIAYSDSLSDLPMLNWADEAYVVSPYTFAKQYNFQEFRF